MYGSGGRRVTGVLPSVSCCTSRSLLPVAGVYGVSVEMLGVMFKIYADLFCKYVYLFGCRYLEVTICDSQLFRIWFLT